MSAARFWRAVALQGVGGGDVELSEFGLIDSTGGRVDGGATLTCTAVPIAGSLSNLSDGSLVSVCRFGARDIAAAGFALVWDFGSTAVDVLEGLLATGGDKQSFLSHFILQQSADGVAWSTVGVKGAYAWQAGNSWAIGSMASPASWSPTDKSSRIALDPQRLTATSGPGYCAVLSDVYVDAGKWYVEMTGSSAFGMPGIASAGFSWESNYPGATAGSIGLYSTSVYIANGVTDISPISSSGTVGLLIDLDARVLRYTNGAATSPPLSIPWAGGVYLTTGNGSSGGSFRTDLNMGGQVIKYAVPAGYVPGFGDVRKFAPLPTKAVGAKVKTFAKPQAMPAAAMRGLAVVNVRDMAFGGAGRIWGTNEIETVPNVRIPAGGRVVLLRQRDKLLVRETWAHPTTGAWEFKGIDASQQYLALAEDLEGNYRPVAANKLQPEVTA